MADVKPFIQGKIQNNKVVMFSKTYCPFCKQAKTILDKYLKEYVVVELDTNPKGEGIQNALAQMTGARTVPRIFINGESIGGADDLATLNKNGNLAKMLN